MPFNLIRAGVAGVLALATLGVATTPASASHLTGGTIAASIDGTGKVTGELLWYESGVCQVGDLQPGASITVTAADASSQSFPIDLKAFRCTASAKYFRSTFTADLADPAATWLGSPPPGRFTVRFSSCCRVGGILNASGGSSNVTLDASARYVPGATTSSPSLLSPVPLGFGIGSGYDADFVPVDPDAAGPITLALLTGAGDPTDPLFDSSAPADQRVALGSDNHVRMTNEQTAGYSVGNAIVYKVRATDAGGDIAMHDVLLRATDNKPPVISAGQDAYTVAPGDTLEIPVVATDPDSGNVVTLDAGSLPSWVKITRQNGNPATAQLTVAPPADASEGVTSFTIDAIDDHATMSLQATRRITITVARPPAVVAEQPVQTPVVTPAPAAPRPFRVISLEQVGTTAGGVLWVDVPGPGRLIAEAVAVRLPKQRKRAKASALRSLKLFARTKAVHQPGRVGVDLRLTRASMKKLARHGLMKVRVEARFIPVEGRTITTQRTMRFKRFSALFVRPAKLRADGKALKLIARVPYAGRLQAVARVTHHGQAITLGRSRVRSVARGERDVIVRFSTEDLQHLLASGSSRVRVTTVLDRKGGGRQTRTRSYRVADLRR